jgi:hypothetical protein
MSKLTDEQWVELTRETVETYNYSGLRLGQAYMNALANVNADLYNEITGTDIDPFYEDKILVDFINFLSEEYG